MSKLASAIENGWSRETSPTRDYLEVVGVIVFVTIIGWVTPLSYQALGHIYLLAVIALSLRVGRWPVLMAAVSSAVTWNFVFMPPRLSFAVLHFDDGLLLGTYFVAALIGGQLAARIREQERLERQRERRATALFHLTRALATARTLDEAAAAALREADQLFNAHTALLLAKDDGELVPHPASSLQLTEGDRLAADWVQRSGQPAGRFTPKLSSTPALHVPLLRAGNILGVFVVFLPPNLKQLPSMQHDLINGFAAQIALLIERERLRAAGEREKLLAESDRLHRTLLDSVSHELKTPLSVLRSATEKLGTNDAVKRQNLVSEIEKATSRLEHLVANLLNQGRLEALEVRPQLDWCDARDVIGAARLATGDALTGHTLSSDVPPDMPLFRADAPLMEQVISNLLLNAAQHTPQGSAIRIATGVDEKRQQMFISVSDNGPGIPPEMRSKLFQKFLRGPAARAGGIGLGLSIVRGFMLAQGGEVEVENCVEGGARFTAYLPHVLHSDVPPDER